MRIPDFKRVLRLRLSRTFEQPPHQVRDTPEWQDHAKAPEEEMGRRGVLYATAGFGRGNADFDGKGAARCLRVQHGPSDFSPGASASRKA
jgi:hypothetical protein